MKCVIMKHEWLQLVGTPWFWLRVLGSSVLIVYVVSLITQYNLLWTVLTQVTDTMRQLELLITLPRELFLNSDPVVASLLIINIFLTAFFFTLIATQQNLAQGHGFVGGIVALFGAGCAACGSLATPFLVSLGAIASLALLGYFNIVMSGMGTILLILAI